MVPINIAKKSLLPTTTPASTPSTTSFLIKHDELAEVLFNENKLCFTSSESDDLSTSDYSDSEYTSYSEFSETDTYTDTYTVDSESDSDDYSSSDMEDDDLISDTNIINTSIEQDKIQPIQQQPPQVLPQIIVSDHSENNIIEKPIITTEELNLNNNKDVNEYNNNIEKTNLNEEPIENNNNNNNSIDISSSLHSLVQNHFNILASAYKNELFSKDIFLQQLEVLFFSEDMARKYFDLVNNMSKEDTPILPPNYTSQYILKKTIDIVEKVNIYRSIMMEQSEENDTIEITDQEIEEKELIHEIQQEQEQEQKQVQIQEQVQVQIQEQEQQEKLQTKQTFDKEQLLRELESGFNQISLVTDSSSKQFLTIKNDDETSESIYTSDYSDSEDYSSDSSDFSETEDYSSSESD